MAQRIAPVIPFVGTPTQRYTGTGDERYVNVQFEAIPNPLTKQNTVFCVKRLGLSNHTQASTSGAGRGIHAWAETGSIYEVRGNNIYRDTTLFTSSLTMNTSTGRCWFVEIPQSTGNHVLIISDGSDNYNITSTHTITQIDETDDADYPVSSLGPVCYLDGFGPIQAQANGRIWNPNINNVTTWTANSYLTADTHAGELEAIHLQKDQLLAFTKNRVEFFYNNGNPTGSPLLRHDQNTLGVGMASRESLGFSGEIALWVGENAGDGDGGRAIYLAASNKIRDVSTPVINRFLQAEGQSITSCTALMERFGGHLLYVLNLQSANRSFAYSVEAGLWSEWQSSSGAMFRGVSATSLNGAIYIQDASNGRVYTMNVSTFRDSGSEFTVRLQTKKHTFGSPSRKYQYGLTLVGDETLGVVTTYVSDDDYQTTSEVGTISMSGSRKYLSRLGGFDSRSYAFSYADNSSFRVQGFIPEIKVGV